MKKLMMVVACALALGGSTVKAAPLYDCGGKAACQAKRDGMSHSSYERNINGCLASAGATRAQWKAHAVPGPAADKVRACLAARG
jgi:hypothetical protein